MGEESVGRIDLIEKPVTLGDVTGDDYIVRGGLKAGERVIVSNIQKLGDGAPVKAS